MLDLEAYLARIGLSGRPGLAEVHRAHVTSIPFENLDPRRGVPVSLVPEDLERKLVRERRGGYCFEQNLLLKAGLEALGAPVETLLARVRVGASPGNPRPRSHLVLRVRADGKAWHADAGFGHGTLLEPIPFGPGGPHEQSGWQFRVVEDGRELVLQTAQEGEWIDLYGFVPEPVPFVDIETSNWFTSTHPHSPFVTGLIVSAQRPDGARVSLSDWQGLSLREETPARHTTRPVQPEEVRELIEERFGLRGFDG
jgi:N-hydroxyarylamine O-acetyltransferase